MKLLTYEAQGLHKMGGYKRKKALSMFRQLLKKQVLLM